MLLDTAQHCATADLWPRKLVASASKMETTVNLSTTCIPMSTPMDSPPSSPLTQFSKSPSPPVDLRVFGESYLPSPPASQQLSETRSVTPESISSGTNTEKAEQPPTKRRRISKERTTKYLDLRFGQVQTEQQDELHRLMNIIHNRQKIVVIAGAGISVSAGIPDFRSSTGLFRSLKQEHKLKGSGKHLFDASVYKDDKSTSSFHDMVSSMSRLTKDAKPTVFHHMLATIAKEGRLLRLYSQNVDGIETSLEPLQTRVPLTKDEDGKWPRTVQLHGGLDKMVCSKCHELSAFDADLFSGPTPPLCPRCEEMDDIRTVHQGKRSHGIGKLRPRMVLYNEHNPDDIAIGSVTRDDLRRRPDAVIVVGTTLKVPGVRRIVREMCSVVRDRRDGDAIWINNDLPPPSKDLEDCFDIVVQCACDDVARLAALRRWDEEVDDVDGIKISEEDARKAHARAGEVHLPVCSPDNQTALCPLTHANMELLPSARHFNNSFSPPPVDATPKKAILPPETWSPMTCSRFSFMQSTENSSGYGASATSKESGLLTPTKEPRSWVGVRQLQPFAEKFFTKGRGAKRSIGGAKSKKLEPAQRKMGPGKRNTAAKTQSELPKSNTIALSFKTTKSATITAKTDSKKPSTTPSKSCQGFNAAEAMVSIPPKPISPRNMAVRFPGLA